MYKYLLREHHEYILSKQVLKSGTSIGANIAEAQYAISTNDFVSKLNIALKECNETLYWLELLYETRFLTDEMYNSMFSDCDEIRKMLCSAIKTIRYKNS